MSRIKSRDYAILIQRHACIQKSTLISVSTRHACVRARLGPFHRLSPPCASERAQSHIRIIRNLDPEATPMSKLFENLSIRTPRHAVAKGLRREMTETN